MMITVVSAACFFIKTGSRRHIDLAAKDWLDSLCPRLPVKIDHTVHNTMVRDGSTVHPQLFHPRHILFYLIGPVQQTVLRVYMQMYKIHILCPSFNKISRKSFSYTKRRSNPFPDRCARFILFKLTVDHEG